MMEKSQHTKQWRKKTAEKMKGNSYGLGYKHTKEQIESHAKGHMIKTNPKSNSEYEMINGLLLSDASLSKPATQFQNSRFMLTQSVKHKAMITYVEETLNDMWFNTSKKTFVRELGTCINLTTKVYPFFTDLRKK